MCQPVLISITVINAVINRYNVKENPITVINPSLIVKYGTCLVLHE